MIIDWSLVCVLIYLFLACVGFFTSVLIVKKAYKVINFDSWMAKRKCNHKYIIVKLCTKCMHYEKIDFKREE